MKLPNEYRTYITHTTSRLVRAVWWPVLRKADRCAVKILLDGIFFDIKLAIIRGKYDIYDPTIQSFIQNLYNLIPEFETSPLLPLRVLQFLQSAWEANKDNDGRYVLVKEISEYFQAMNIDARATLACLASMLARG